MADSGYLPDVGIKIGEKISQPLVCFSQSNDLSPCLGKEEEGIGGYKRRFSCDDDPFRRGGEYNVVSD